MWTCSTCGALNSDGMDSCCGLPKSPQKSRSQAKVKTAVEATRKLVKPRKRATGQAGRYYCTKCGERVWVTTQAHILRMNTEYIHHNCVEAIYDR